MRILLGIVAAIGAAAVASADEPVAPDGAQTCDFFQSELTYVSCGNTASFSLSADGTEMTVRRTVLAQPHNASADTIQHYNYLEADEGAALVVSPWQGVRLIASGAAFEYDNSYSEQFTPLGGLLGPATHTTDRLGGDVGWESVGAEATIWEQETDTGRYVLSVSGGAELFPGGGAYTARDLQQVGFASAALWRLGDSGYTLDYSGTISLQRFDNPGEYMMASQARLLLASVDYGIAAGPLLIETNVLSHAARFNTGWSETDVGGEAVAAPFRKTTIPVLKDMTINMTATHSIGQAALIPVAGGSASAFNYRILAQFNFRY